MPTPLPDFPAKSVSVLDPSKETIDLFFEIGIDFPFKANTSTTFGG